MPKTYNDLYDDIVSIEGLYNAYNEITSQKRFKPSTLIASSHIEATIDGLHNDLQDMTWQPDEYRQFMTKKEVKRRIVNEPSFRDRILQNSISIATLPLFRPKFIYHSYAALPGKGPLEAARTAQRFMRAAGRNGPVYVLQCDIRHYYDSVHHDILIDQISRTIRDKRLMEIWSRMIRGFNSDTGIGIALGARTNQLGANIYLNVLDHFVKECIGWKYYLRFMDDFMLIGNSKQELRSALADIEWLLDTALRLKLNDKTKIFSVKQGADYVGYRIFLDHFLPRKRNVKAARIRFKDLSRRFRHGEITVEDAGRRVQSFLGYMSHCNGKHTTESTLKYLKLTKEDKNNGKNSIDCHDHGI